MDAIYTLKTLENQHRDATPEEQETLEAEQETPEAGI